ncbi:MAG: CBS domain-containing protein [Planctomycetaceae bacterium]
MRLNDIMTRGVETISADQTIQEAASKMRDADVGFLPVIQEETAVGILTDRDIVVRGVADGFEAVAYVGEIMSRGAAKEAGEVDPERTGSVVSLHLDEDVATALELMRRKKMRRLLVHDDDYRLVGVVSLADVARAAPAAAAAT